MINTNIIKAEEALLLKSLETNLIPAVVPDLSNLPVIISVSHPHVISTQPMIQSSARRGEQANNETELKDSAHHNYNHHQPKKNTPDGLVRLTVAEEVVISYEGACLNCIRSSTGSKYFIRDVSKGEESLIFEATEGSVFWSVGSLRNVVIRDREDVPVARVCFKEKHFLLDSLVLAVYSPPETLIGTVEESPTCFVFSSEFMLGNADGDHLFRINYDRGLCTSQFLVTSLQNEGSAREKVAQIVEKSGETIRVKFISKMSISSKLILVGFCIGIIHKKMSQASQS